MEEIASFEETLDALEKSWEIGVPQILEDENPMEMLRKALVPKILNLLLDDFEGLISAMYRLDIPEHLFHETMALSEPQKIAEALSHVVLKREIIRIETRKKYSQK